MCILRDDSELIHLDYTLLVVGDGALRANCEEFASRERLNVKFVGFLNQTQIPDAYSIADCLILPSERETWGMVVNEAMACGTPAIVSDQVGCAPDLVENGKTGYTYTKGDIADLANKMKRYLLDPELTNDNGNAAKERVKKYTIDEAVVGVKQAIEFVHNRNCR